MLNNSAYLFESCCKILNVLCTQLGNWTLMIKSCRKISLSSELSSLNEVEKFIQDLVTDYKICKKRYSDILVAVSAAVSNAIHYGHREHCARIFYLEFDLFESKSLKFIVSDPGPGFDFNNVPDPTDPNNSDQGSGKGVYLMRKLSDNCTFNKNGSEVVLEFKL